MTSALDSERLDYQRVFVTGATGFVGKYLVPALQATLAPDATITIGTPGGAKRFPDTAAVHFDLCDEESIGRAIKEAQPDLIIHLAGEASVAAAAEAAARTWQINAFGGLMLARAIASTSPYATFLFASSAEVYGSAFLRGATDELTPPEPKSVYAQSKLAAEHLLSAVLPQTARLITMRPANHVGPGQDERFVMPAFAEQLAAIALGQKPPVISVGNLDARRDFTDVRDVVNCYIRLLAAAPALPSRTTFNLASGRVRSIREVLEGLVACAGVQPKIMVDPARSRPSEIIEARINADSVRTALGWAPMIPWISTLEDVYNFALQGAARVH